MPQENTGTMRALCDAFNKRDWDTARQLLADDCEWVVMSTGRVTHGGAELVAASQQFWMIAVPDLRVDIVNLINAGDTVVIEWSAGGTMRGPLQLPEGWYPATKRSYRRRGCSVAELRDGKIVRYRDYSDAKTLLDQLGLSSMTPSATPVV